MQPGRSGYHSLFTLTASRMELMILFYSLLFLVAFLYSSVGHGGASGYLALMALFGISPDVMRPTALLLNLFVAGTAFIQFYRGKHFIWKIFLPIAIASIPMAFIGGLVRIDPMIYKKVLGFFLLVPAARFLYSPVTTTSIAKEPNTGISVLLGTSIGFLSGLIGIGGGIILSPILLLLGWTDQKQTAAISALFIFVNSLSGLGGHFTWGVKFSSDMVVYVAIAFAGGLAGSYFGSLRFRQDTLKYLLAFVLLLASLKLLFTKG